MNYETERYNREFLTETFRVWCSEMSTAVVSREPILEFAHDGDRDGGRPGYFSYQGRFVNFALKQDGRVLVSGLQAVSGPIEPGLRIQHAPVLFEGGLARMLRMNTEGSQLGQRTIATWLLRRDGELHEIRAAFQVDGD